MKDPCAVCCLALLPLLLAFGCNTPGSRIKENEGLFATYPPDVQATIRSGQIRQGFDQNQVYMALGKPAKKKALGASETWLYARVVQKKVTTKKDVYKYELERREYEDKIARGQEANEPTMEETRLLKRTRVFRVVEFTDNRVSSWEDPTDEYLNDWHE